MESILKEYDALVKNKGKTNESYRTKEKQFQDDIKSNIMDIAHSQAIEMMKNQKDIRFLEMQRENPKSCTMGSVDMKLHRKETRKMKRLQNINDQQEKARKLRESANESVILLNESSSSTESDNTDPAVEFASSSSSSNKNNKKRLKNRITQDLVTTYDRLNILYRDSAMAYAVTAKALGYDLNEVSVSSSTMYRARLSHRKDIAESYDSKEFCPGYPLVLHWDGKILTDIKQSRESVERIAVLVSGDCQEKLLGIPKISNGTGKEIAKVCLNLLKEHKMEDSVRGLSFDTTPVNTGIHIGACTLIEEGLRRDLMYFACRHHIYEVVLSHVFKYSYGPSTGPDILVFKRFQEQWNSINPKEVQAYDFTQVNTTIKTLRNDSILLVRKFVNTTQQRNDYTELLQLVLIFLGEASIAEFPLKAPGAFHHSRWMAKAIYSLKLVLLKKQFKISSNELKSLTEISLFVSLVYIRGWSRAANSIHAATVDLEFVSDAEAFARAGFSIGTIAQKAISRHLWYLSEYLIAMSFFDTDVPDTVKVQMLSNLQKKKLTKR